MLWLDQAVYLADSLHLNAAVVALWVCYLLSCRYLCMNLHLPTLQPSIVDNVVTDQAHNRKNWGGGKHLRSRAAMLNAI